MRPENAANEAMTSRISVSWNVTVIGGCWDCWAVVNNGLLDVEVVRAVTIGSLAGGVGSSIGSICVDVST